MPCDGTQLAMKNQEPFDPIPTRYSLLERLKDWGDQTSWQEFYDIYSRLLYRVALRSGLTDTEAQEAVQETVIAVARKMPQFKADPARGSFSAWLMRLTRWRIADQFRKRQDRMSGVAGNIPPGPADDTGSTDPVYRVPDPAAPPLETIWAQEWEKNLMAAALDLVKRQVSARQYQIFDLHAVQHLSTQETAQTLKVSVASVYMAKSRVSRLLKQALKELESIS